MACAHVQAQNAKRKTENTQNAKAATVWTTRHEPAVTSIRSQEKDGAETKTKKRIIGEKQEHDHSNSVLATNKCKYRNARQAFDQSQFHVPFCSHFHTHSEFPSMLSYKSTNTAPATLPRKIQSVLPSTESSPQNKTKPRQKHDTATNSRMIDPRCSSPPTMQVQGRSSHSHHTRAMKRSTSSGVLVGQDRDRRRASGPDRERSHSTRGKRSVSRSPKEKRRSRSLSHSPKTRRHHDHQYQEQHEQQQRSFRSSHSPKPSRRSSKQVSAREQDLQELFASLSKTPTYRSSSATGSVSASTTTTAAATMMTPITPSSAPASSSKHRRSKTPSPTMSSPSSSSQQRTESRSSSSRSPKGKKSKIDYDLADFLEEKEKRRKDKKKSKKKRKHKSKSSKKAATQSLSSGSYLPSESSESYKPTSVKSMSYKDRREEHTRYSNNRRSASCRESRTVGVPPSPASTSNHSRRRSFRDSSDIGVILSDIRTERERIEGERKELRGLETYLTKSGDELLKKWQTERHHLHNRRGGAMTPTQTAAPTATATS